MSKSKRARVRKTGLSTQPWRKADVAYLQERAAAVGLTLRFTMEGSRLRPRVRTVHVETESTETALAFITEHFGLASSPYRARAITTQVVAAAASPPPSAPETTSELRCSFCSTHQNEVKHLVAGPGVFICDSCVQICCDVIDHRDGPEKFTLYDLDESALVLIAKLVRAVPADVPDTGVPAAIDKMMEEQLREVSRWRDLRNLPAVSVMTAPPSTDGSAWGEAVIAAVGMGPLAYLWAAQKGKKTSPTSAEDAASSTVGEKNQ